MCVYSLQQRLYYIAAAFEVLAGVGTDAAAVIIAATEAHLPSQVLLLLLVVVLVARVVVVFVAAAIVVAATATKATEVILCLVLDPQIHPTLERHVSLDPKTKITN